MGQACPAGYSGTDADQYCVPEGLYLRVAVRGAALGWEIYGRTHSTIKLDKRGLISEVSDRRRQAGAANA